MLSFVSINCFLVVLFTGIASLAYSAGLLSSINGFILLGDYFLFDSISYYLIILVLFLGVYSQVLFFNLLSNECRLFLVASMVFSILCFCINHAIIFWCCYELAMLPLLYLIFKESPYSERFAAGWYFLGYLAVTSLPLILILLYLSHLNSTFFFSCWAHKSGSLVTYTISFALAFVFFTKVPLIPFHTWLPIVHAEATSIVSIFLSGYIMKLGLLGAYRCLYFMFNFSMIGYLFLCCFMSIIFLVVACGELDGKRWLAFLSLSHIVIPFYGFFISDWSVINVSFFYCLGHGLSAGLIFGLLWYLYDLGNSRNWVLLKSCVNSGGGVLLTVFSMLSLCSFPPTMQFFSEVYLIVFSSGALLYVFFWLVYLFLGGLVPLVLCGHLLIRSECLESSHSGHYNYCYFLFYLCSWCYVGVFIL